MNKFFFLICLSVVSISLGGCSTAGLYLLNATVKTDRNQVKARDIAYGDKGWQKLDVYPHPNTNKPAPVVMFLYGGSWDSGEKRQYYFVANAFLKLGYTVVIPDYAKYPDSTFPEFVEDGAAAFAWIKHNIADHNGDPENIFIVGHSAGAHTGALLATDPDYLSKFELSKQAIRGFAGLAGPYGFTPTEPKFIAIFGGESNFHKMKAMNHVNGTEPPMILMHGLGDKTVGVLNKDTLVEALQDVDSEVRSVTYDDVSHVGILLKFHPRFAGKIDIAREIDQFFKPRLTAKKMD